MSRYQPETLEQRIVEEWEAEARVLDDESIQLAKEFSETYSPAVATLFDLFTRLDTHRQRISALHQRRPAGVESVRDPELLARNLDAFDRERPSLLGEVHLIDSESGREIWPRRAPVSESAFAAPIYDRGLGADWAQHNEQREAARRAEQQRHADFFARQTKQQEERENREAREAFRTQQQCVAR